MDLQAVEVMHRSHIGTNPQRFFRPFNEVILPFLIIINIFMTCYEPANIPRDAYDVSPLNRNVGVCVKDGIMIMDPTKYDFPSPLTLFTKLIIMRSLANSTPAVVPSFVDATGYASMGALKTRVHAAKPLGLVRAAPTELLAVYDGNYSLPHRHMLHAVDFGNIVLGCYITKRGVPSRSAGFIKWETPATSYTCRGTHLLLFSALFIEVRDLTTGRIVQVIEGTNIRLLHAGGPTYGEDEAILVAMKGTKDDEDGTSERIVELLQTSLISSAPAAPMLALWDEWDM